MISAVEDDKSQVDMTYCVGTFSGGCDVINNRELGGAVKIAEVPISYTKVNSFCEVYAPKLAIVIFFGCAATHRSPN